jgi:synaptobrevin family protein YKT6
MHILHKRDQNSIFLCSRFAIDFVGYFKQGKVKEFLFFGARTTINKLKRGETVRLDLEELEDTIVFAHINESNIATVVICDKEYPESAAVKILLEMQKKFLDLYTPSILENYKSDQEMKFPELDSMIVKYQDPKEADKLMKIEKELVEIQGMLHKTMNDLLDRGEKLDDLVKQSEDISYTAKQFYSNAKKTNQKCCSLY